MSIEINNLPEDAGEKLLFASGLLQGCRICIPEDDTYLFKIIDTVVGIMIDVANNNYFTKKY